MRTLFDAFRSHEKELYMVGGAVRDLAMGTSYESLHDLDFTTNATPEEMIRILGGFKTFRPSNQELGTMGVVYNGKEAHITPYRAKGYRGPGITIAPELEPLAYDLSHRDFTINAIALDESGNRIDPFGGLPDIEKKIIRAVNGSTEEMLKESPIRALRCARFLSKLGFQVEDKLFDAIKSRYCALGAVSGEMKKEETDKLLVGYYVKEALQFLMDSGIAECMLPEIVPMAGLEQPEEYHHKDVWEHTKAVVANIRPDYVLRWVALMHDAGKPQTRSVSEGKIHFYKHEEVGAEMFDGMAQRLRFPDKERRAGKSLVSNHLLPLFYDSTWTDSAVRRLVRRGGDYLEELLELSRADLTSQNPEKIKEGLQSLDDLKSRIKGLEEQGASRICLPKSLGYSVMKEFGLGQGPEVGRLKRLVEEAAIDGKISTSPSAEECMEFLRKTKT